jgi:hypothetical protein
MSPSDACCIYSARGKYSGIGGAASYVKTDHKPCCGGTKDETVTSIKQLTGKNKDVFNSFFKKAIKNEI